MPDLQPQSKLPWLLMVRCVSDGRPSKLHLSYRSQQYAQLLMQENCANFHKQLRRDRWSSSHCRRCWMTYWQSWDVLQMLMQTWQGQWHCRTRLALLWQVHNLLASKLLEAAGINPWTLNGKNSQYASFPSRWSLSLMIEDTTHHDKHLLCQKLPYSYSEHTPFVCCLTAEGETKSCTVFKTLLFHLQDDVAYKELKATRALLVSFLKNLHSKGGWPYSRMHLFGFSQGGTVALDLAAQYRQASDLRRNAIEYKFQ